MYTLYPILPALNRASILLKKNCPHIWVLSKHPVPTTWTQGTHPSFPRMPEEGTSFRARRFRNPFRFLESSP